MNQIAQGDGYPNLNDVVGITICDFALWPDTEARRLPMLTRWRMTEQQIGAKEVGQIQLVFLELPKYDASRPPQTVVDQWAYFLDRPPWPASCRSPGHFGSPPSSQIRLYSLRHNNRRRVTASWHVCQPVPASGVT